MNLNINSPAYYAEHYGIDDEIYWLCREICSLVQNKEYSTLVNIVGLIPVVAPINLTEKGAWRESIKYDLNFGLVTITRHINYDNYINADIDEKKKLMIRCILDAMYAIRRKGKFNYEQFKKDILVFLNYSEDELGIR